MRLLLAHPRGFCAGVDRAVDVVEVALKMFGKPLYVKHEIVHNKFVVETLTGKGVIFVDSVEQVPEGSTVVFSAHGSPPEDYQKAEIRKLRVFDATCPLVTKVHLEARRYAKEGFSIILIGHKGHVEVAGIAAEAKDCLDIIETVEEADKIAPKNQEKLVYLSQTTLSVEETRGIIAALKKRFPHIVEPPSSDICYSTTNRQLAVKKIAEQSQVVFVVGSKNSSNSNRLREVAESGGAKAILVDSSKEIDADVLKGVEVVGVTAGASAPAVLIVEVVNKLRELGVNQEEEIVSVEEKIKFPLPQDLKTEALRKNESLELFRKHEN